MLSYRTSRGMFVFFGEEPLPDWMTEAHTERLSDGHRYQIVAAHDRAEALYVLECIDAIINNGNTLDIGSEIYGIYDDAPVRIDTSEDINGDSIRQITIPDMHGTYYDIEGCETPYSLQFLGTEKLAMLGAYDKGNANAGRRMR